MALTVLAYWVGLYGPFVFDDGPNFAGIEAWLAGKQDLEEVLFGNTSLLTNRTLAMATFAANAAWFGYTPFSFKIVNLFLHLLSGLVAYRVLAGLALRDALLAKDARLLAAIVVTIWLLHPYNVSTVLYAVQRMTQIAALCCLGGLWLYISTRSKMETRTTAGHWVALFVGIPLLTLLGIQGKQSAIVLPGLCLVVELAFFMGRARWPKPLVAFYALLLVLPATGLILGAFLKPHLLLDGFGEYPFTLTQRLLSESRVLVEYIQMSLLPNPPRMGVYTDDFTPSLGLFKPLSTVIAILFLSTISIAAWRFRKLAPSVFAGWFLFLVGHSVEASILPIELYYEHRNYLPGLGLFYAVAALAAAASRALSKQEVRMGRVGAVTGLALVAVLAIQTHGRSRVWSDRFLLAESELVNHPNSVRAVLNYAWLAKISGDPTRAIEVLDHAIATSREPKVQGLARVFRMRINCELKGSTPPGEIDKAVAVLPPHIDLVMAQVIGYSEYLQSGARPCDGITSIQFADALVRLADRAHFQPDGAFGKWTLRYQASSLYANSGDWKNAEIQGQHAWQPNATAVVAGPLILALAKTAQFEQAEKIYAESARRADLSRPGDVEGLANFRSAIEQARRLEASAPKS